MNTGTANTSAAAPDVAPTGRPAAGAGNGNATAMTDIHDIKPALALDGGLTWIYWVLGVLALLGLVALGWWLWQRRRKPEAGQPAAATAPEQEAYQALDALAAVKGLTPKQFYYRLSAVIRHYTERRFDFPAAEMTTEELLPRVDRLPLDPELAGALKTFCRCADPVKFAGASAGQERMTHDLVFARTFVRQTTAAVRAEKEEVNAAPDVTAMAGGHQRLELKRESREKPV